MPNLLIKVFLLLFTTTGIAHAQPVLPYKNAALPLEKRVEDLLSRMTPEEKFWQMFMIPGELKPGEEHKYFQGIFGLQVSATSANGDAAGQMLQYNAVENGKALAQKINGIQKYFVEKSRLGIPIIAFDEALHGLVRGGATAFPQAIALAATWDTALMREVASAIALETKVRGIRQILSPVINLASDVRWGRTEETYGEDPFLSAAMGVAFMGAFERMGIITTPKHFLANVGEGGRDSYPIQWSEWYLRQTHLVPFKEAIEKAGARSIMTAYNSLNGKPSTANDWLLTDWLKKEIGFKGFVISDASATGGANVLHMTAADYPESSAQAINAGLDVIFQTDYENHKLFIPPFLNGKINMARIDDAVRRVLRAKFELGLFENPYVNEADMDRLVSVTVHKALAAKAAGKSIVLLKNEGVLPLSSNIKTLAVIGEDAIAARLGGYSGPGNGTISILTGLKSALGAGTNVTFAPGYSRKGEDFTTISTSYLSFPQEGKKVSGLKGAYYNHADFSNRPVFERTDAIINFHWTLYAPDPRLPRDFFAVSWQGMITSDETGTFQIGLEGNDGYRLYLNDTLLIDKFEKRSFSTTTKPWFFEQGKPYRIRVDFKEPSGNAHIRLVWNKDADNPWKDLQQQAVLTAQQADAVVLVAGIHEGEFQDRAMLNLDHHQEELIEAVAATGKPVTVLLVGGSAITMNRWLDKVNAVAMVWYPGETGGMAIGEMLTGKINPAGRLPITFPIHEAQLPLSYWHLPTGRGDDYHNMSGQPLFPFGYGLSYTRFLYTDLKMEKDSMRIGETTRVSFTITNEGNFDGEEVVQLYLRDELASVARPVMELKGFQRVMLKKGEKKTIHFDITPNMLQMLTADNKTVIEPGSFRIMIGSSSRELQLKTMLVVRE
jgi:beta-glucosidase